MSDLPKLRFHEVQKLKLAKCPDCDQRMTKVGEMTTLAARHEPIDDLGRKHVHDPNRVVLDMKCMLCGFTQSTAFRNACSVQDCDET